MRLRPILVTLFFCISISAFAQQDSLKAISELPTGKESVEHSPKKAAIMSACLPGLGQIYNKSYWKVPVVYAGFYGLGYMFKENNNYYQEVKVLYDDFRNPYLERGESLPDTTFTLYGVSGIPTYRIKELRDEYRRKRDLALIGAGVWYVLTIVESYVDAHMYTFDISDDLTLRYEPSFYTAGTSITGIRFSLTF